MKKLILVLSTMLLTTMFITGCSNTCDYDGCKNEATGWKHYTTRQPGPFGGCIGCCRMEPDGGYCSRDHCAEDQ